MAKQDDATQAEWFELDVDSLPKVYQDRFAEAEAIEAKFKKAAKEAIDFYITGVSDQIASGQAMVIVRKWGAWRFTIGSKRRANSKATALMPKK